jgi:hypothetical protein
MDHTKKEDVAQTEHRSHGGSYVIGADNSVTLVERGDTEPKINTAEVVVPEHEAEKAKEAEKAAKAAAKKSGHAPVGDTPAN